MWSGLLWMDWQVRCQPRGGAAVSIGCGDEPFIVSTRQIEWGGILPWRQIIFAAMRLKSLNAVNQSRLLIGPEQVIRMDAPADLKIAMDDWRRACALLPGAADRALDVDGDRVASMFLRDEAEPYHPLVPFQPEHYGGNGHA